MRRILLVSCCLGLFVVALMAYAQTEEKEAPKCPCPICAVAEGKAMAGVPEAMVLRCRMMLATRWNAYAPSSLLAIKDDIKLTPEQIEILGESAKEVEAAIATASEDAKALLTDAQLEKMDSVAKRLTPWWSCTVR